jgi:hypothetical protein
MSELVNLAVGGCRGGTMSGPYLEEAMPAEDVVAHSNPFYGSGSAEAAPVSAMVWQLRPQAEHRHSLTTPVGK